MVHGCGGQHAKNTMGNCFVVPCKNRLLLIPHPDDELLADVTLLEHVGVHLGEVGLHLGHEARRQPDRGAVVGLLQPLVRRHLAQQLLRLVRLHRPRLHLQRQVQGAGLADLKVKAGVVVLLLLMLLLLCLKTKTNAQCALAILNSKG